MTFIDHNYSLQQRLPPDLGRKVRGSVISVFFVNHVLGVISTPVQS